MLGSTYVHCISLSVIYIMNCTHKDLILIFFDEVSKWVEIFFFSVLQMYVISNISKTNNGLDFDSYFRGPSWGVCPFRERREGVLYIIALRVCISLFRFVKVWGKIK